ncbi:cytochrome P450 [Streptomyces sp. AK02-04a]|nr:cytochrome P450 [Streptomyces sp. AK02-04a]MDX3763871.1 cytochrome P450 [Streptomyces sp. AK02-04a]
MAYGLYLIHHNTDLYINPEDFDPDRWDPNLALSLGVRAITVP